MKSWHYSCLFALCLHSCWLNLLGFRTRFFFGEWVRNLINTQKALGFLLLSSAVVHWPGSALHLIHLTAATLILDKFICYACKKSSIYLIWVYLICAIWTACLRFGTQACWQCCWSTRGPQRSVLCVHCRMYAGLSGVGGYSNGGKPKKESSPVLPATTWKAASMFSSGVNCQLLLELSSWRHQALPSTHRPQPTPYCRTCRHLRCLSFFLETRCLSFDPSAPVGLTCSHFFLGTNSLHTQLGQVPCCMQNRRPT